MQLSNIPGKLVLPFANAGGKSTIPVASQIGITAGAASLTDGFPPLTRTPIAAGGVPPSGLDMNGILYEMSAIIRWANAGGGYPYDGTFATDTNVGGYPKGARIMRSDGTGYWFNTVENNVTDPESAGAAAAGWVPDYQSGTTSVAMSGSSVTLTPNQYGKPLIVITGALSANLNLIFPTLAQGWTVINNTTGGYSITAKTASGSGVTLGTISQIVGDGTNMYAANPDSVQIVTNVATLRNIAPNLSRRIQTKGYYTDGDGGGSQYFPKVGAAPGTYVDNGGTVIVPNGGDGSVAWLLDVTGFISIRQFGASPTMSASVNVTAISKAILNCFAIFIPDGNYEINNQIPLRSNVLIEFSGDAKLIMSLGISDKFVFYGNSLSNIILHNVVIEGNGASGVSSAYLVSCSNVLFDNPIISKSGSMAIQLDGCSNVTIRGGDLSNNYYYGVMDRDGIGNRYIGTRYFQNGNTGVATNAGGRGINLWRCIDCYVVGNRFSANTEYGFRLYSEAADLAASYGNRVVDNYFQDNVSADVVLYDESLAGTLIKQNVITGNIAQRSTNPSLGMSFLLHGGDNTIDNNHVYKSGSFGTFAAFYLYYAVRNKVLNCSAHNTHDASVWSNATDCLIDNMEGNAVATACGPAGIIGSGNILRNSKFKHGDIGASDVAAINYNATGKNRYQNNEFDGFHTGLHIGNEAVAIFGNTSKNSGFSGIRKNGNDLSLQEFGGNSWDSSTPWELSALNKTISTYDHAKTYYLTSPASLSWMVGDRCYNSTPSVGQPKSWVCTVAGTPGTWVSEGNL